MEARLVYMINGTAIELERMDLESLDGFTYNGFDNEEDIVNSPRYQDKLSELSKDGEVKVVFDGYDVPIKALDYFTAFGNDPFGGVHSISVLTGDRKIGPSKRSIRENIARTLCDVKVVEDFHEVFKDKFTLKEEFYYLAGLMAENDDDLFLGIKRIVADATTGPDAYFIGRIFLEGLSNFESVKNKDEKGRLYAPQLNKTK